jgi:MFS family permease
MQVPAAPSPAPAVYVRAHWRTLVSVFGGIGIGQLGFSATAFWIPTIASRSYGASAAQAGQGMGEAYVLSTLGGALLGAVAVPFVKSRLGPAAPIRVIVTGLLVSAVAAAGLLLARSGAQLYLLFGAQMAAITAGTMLVPTLLQDITPPLLRSRTIAIGSFVMVTLTSLSPLLVGAVSDALRASPQGLVVAVVAVAAIALVTSAVLLQTAQAAVVRTVQGITLGATPMLREL